MGRRESGWWCHTYSNFQRWEHGKTIPIDFGIFKLKPSRNYPFSNFARVQCFNFFGLVQPPTHQEAKKRFSPIQFWGPIRATQVPDLPELYGCNCVGAWSTGGNRPKIAITVVELISPSYLAGSLGCFRANLQEHMVFCTSNFGFSVHPSRQSDKILQLKDWFNGITIYLPFIHHLCHDWNISTSPGGPCASGLGRRSHPCQQHDTEGSGSPSWSWSLWQSSGVHRHVSVMAREWEVNFPQFLGHLN